MSRISLKEWFYNLYEKEHADEEHSYFFDCHFKKIKSNLMKFDEAIGEYTPGQFIVIAGPTATGKTQLIVSLMTGFAVNQSVPVELFSLEMSNSQIITKIISNVCALDQISESVGETETSQETITGLISAPIYIDDTAATPIQTLRENIIKSSVTNNVKIIFIDNLQLIKDYESTSEDVLRELKHVADEAQVTIIALSRLKSPAPRFSPIFLVKDNIISIERIMTYADTVAILQRPAKYSYAIALKLPDLTTMSFIKNQNGVIDPIDFSYDYQTSKFADYMID